VLPAEGGEVTDFASILTGLDAESRKQMIESAEEFLRNRTEYETCLFCGKNLTDLVCDAPIGFEMAGYKEAVKETPFTRSREGYRYMDRASEMFTCDLPVCESCRKQGEPIFFCGSSVDRMYADALGEKDSTDPSGVFVPDLCPIHHTAPSLGGERKPVITHDEANAWRTHARMLIQAGKTGNVPPYPEGGN